MSIKKAGLNPDCLDLNDLIGLHATDFMRKSNVTVRQITFPGSKKRASMSIKPLYETEALRILTEFKMITVEKTDVRLESSVKTEDNFTKDIIAIDFKNAIKARVEKTALVAIYEGKAYTVDKNMHVMDEDNNETNIDPNAAELFLVQYNSNSSATADLYLGFQVRLQNGEINVDNIAKMYKLLGIRTEQMNKEGIIKLMGRFYQKFSPSIPLPAPKAYIILFDAFCTERNKVTNKKGSCVDGVSLQDDLKAVQLMNKTGIPADLKDNKVCLYDTPVNPRINDQNRTTTSKSFAVACGQKTAEWFKQNYKLVTVCKYDPLAQKLLNTKGKMPGYEGTEGILVYTKDKNERVEYIVDKNSLKADYDITKDYEYSVLKVAHASKKTVALSRQMFTKFYTRDNKIVNIMRLLFIRQFRDILHDNLEEPKERRLLNSYINEVLKKVNYDLFAKDELFFKNSFDNSMKAAEKLIKNLNVRVSGKCSQVVCDPSKIIALREGKDPILKEDEAIMDDVFPGQRIFLFKHPTQRTTEYMRKTTVSRKTYRKRLQEESDISPLGKEAILEQFERLSSGVCVINVTLEDMEEIATFDVDGDAMSILMLALAWRRDMMTVQKTTSLKANQVGMKDVKEKYCYIIADDVLKRFRIVNIPDGKKGVCYFNPQTQTDSNVTITFVPLERDVIDFEYKGKDSRIRKEHIDVTELDAQLVCLIDRLYVSEKRTYVQIAEDSREISYRGGLKEETYDFTPEVLWQMVQSLVHFNEVYVGQIANATTILYQIVRELTLSEYEELHHLPRSFKGISPVFREMAGKTIFTGKSKKPYCGLLRTPISYKNYTEKVVLSSDNMEKAIEELKTAKATKSGFRRALKDCELMNYYFIDAVIGSKKAAEAVIDNLQPIFNGIKIGSMQGAKFTRTRTSKTDMLTYTTKMDIMNERIANSNTSNNYQITPVIRDEFMNFVEEVCRIFTGMATGLLPDNNLFKDITETAYKDIKNPPIGGVVLAKWLHTVNYQVLELARNYDNDDDDNYYDSEDDDKKDDTGMATYNEIRLATGNTFLLLAHNLTPYEAGIMLKYWSLRSVKVKTFGTIVKPSKLYRILEKVVTKALLKLATGTNTYVWPERIVPITNDATPLQDGESVEVCQGFINGEYMTLNRVADGMHKVIVQTNLDEDTDEITYVYNIVCELNYDEIADNTSNPNKYALMVTPGKQNIDDIAKTLTALIDTVCHIVIGSDKKGKLHHVLLNDKDEIVTELFTSTMFNSTSDMTDYVAQLKTLNTVKITGVHSTKTWAIALIVDNEGMTQLTNDEVDALFNKTFGIAATVTAAQNNPFTSTATTTPATQNNPFTSPAATTAPATQIVIGGQTEPDVDIDDEEEFDCTLL